MDARSYTLIVIAVLCVLFAALALGSLARYRRAVRQARQAQAIEDDGREAYLGAAAEHADDVFAVANSGAAPRARVHIRPESVPVVHREPGGSREPTPFSERIEREPAWSPMSPAVQPSVPIPGADGGGAPAEAQVPVEPTPTATPSLPRVTATPDALVDAVGADADTARQQSSPPGYSLADELDRLMDTADSQTPLLSAEEHTAAVAASTPEVHDEPVFEQPPVMPPLARGEILSAPVAEPPAERVAEPGSIDDPVPVAEVVPITAVKEPVPAPAPVTAPAPVPPPAPVTAPAPAPLPGPAPAPVPEPAPVPAPAPAPVVAEAPRATPETPSAAEPAVSAAPEIPEYRLVAPVELHFTGGGGRVGVRPGSRTYDEFQRLAAALLDRGTQH